MHAGASAPSSTPDTSSHSRGAFRPSFALRFTPPKQRAQGRPGAGWHPRSAARKCSAKRPHSSIQVTPNTRPSLRDGRTAYAVLSPETNSFCLRHLTKFAGTAPVDADTASARLDRSDDGRDHTVLPYAHRLMPQRLSAVCTRAEGMVARRTSQRRSSTRGFGLTGTTRPARAISCRRCRVHRIPGSRCVTTYDRPSGPSRDGRHIRHFRISVKRNIFGRQD